ncbi:MAG: [FeFe] hydrogenase, group A [Candidatus Hydrothermae bacterium]|nr:[FeFe] hydrogenase, group A [Candidatus Hydrothermae bacterium]
MVKLYIDGKEVEVDKDATILDAAKKVGVHIPTLCYHADLSPTGACGVCVVEIEGSPTPKRSCCTPVAPGMKVTSNSKYLREIRKALVQLILSNHDVTCPTCPANEHCELQSLANYLGVDTDGLPTVLEKKPIDETSIAIVRDPNKCILCGRCVNVCNDIQTVSALTIADRGFDATIDTFFSLGMGNSACVNCGQCTVFCPTGALSERSEIDLVWDALLDPDKVVVVQEAPSIRATLGEEFGMEIGTVTVGKMYAAMRRLGFDVIFDTNFAADLTIMEEANELVERIKNGGALPLITSCSPGWIKFMETFFPDLAKYVSTCKSPQQMFGALVKTYFAKESGIDPSKIVSVSIMPCTAKKFEARRPEMRDSGYQDVDYVLTTRELVRMLKAADIDLKTLPDEKPDELMGMYTGAATIFGATGGVMEAAVRTAYWMLTGKDLPNLDIEAVRGMAGIKEAELDINGMKVKVAVAHGLGNARTLLTKVKEQIEKTGQSEYAFIEIMACPGGCVGGGGQPKGSTFAMRARRGEGLYKEDRELPYRKSHENPAIIRLYDKFLGKQGSELAHRLLHTHYFKRSNLDGACVEAVTEKHVHH